MRWRDEGSDRVLPSGNGPDPGCRRGQIKPIPSNSLTNSAVLLRLMGYFQVLV
jgi:hypothetical protein